MLAKPGSQNPAGKGVVAPSTDQVRRTLRWSGAWPPKSSAAGRDISAKGTVVTWFKAQVFDISPRNLLLICA